MLYFIDMFSYLLRYLTVLNPFCLEQCMHVCGCFAYGDNSTTNMFHHKLSDVRTEHGNIIAVDKVGEWHGIWTYSSYLRVIT